MSDGSRYFPSGYYSESTLSEVISRVEMDLIVSGQTDSTDAGISFKELGSFTKVILVLGVDYDGTINECTFSGAQAKKVGEGYLRVGYRTVRVYELTELTDSVEVNFGSVASFPASAFYLVFAQH